MKRQDMDQEDIFENYIPNKGLVSRICKAHSNSMIREQDNFKKKRKGLEQTFHKESIRMANKHVKRQYHKTLEKCKLKTRIDAIIYILI